jgi:ABC-type antimicrobial peptide transport system, ATPase component
MISSGRQRFWGMICLRLGLSTPRLSRGPISGRGRSLSSFSGRSHTVLRVLCQSCATARLASEETYHGRPECDRWCTDAGRRRHRAFPDPRARAAARAAGRSIGAKHASRFVSAGETLLEARGIVRTYRRGDIAVPVLKGLDLDVRRGEWVACTGRSGSGKSTLLRARRHSQDILSILTGPIQRNRLGCLRLRLSRAA